MSSVMMKQQQQLQQLDQLLMYATPSCAFGRDVPSVVSERKRGVNYDSNNTFGVLTQMRGSVWPKVLPYCVANSALTYVIYWLKHERGVDLTFPDKGHTFLAAILSFLVVTRSNIAYARYWEARTELSRAMKSCRELVQHAITFSRYDTSPGAQHWRSDVARRTIVLLRTVVSVLEYQTSGQHAWKIPELTKDEKQALLSAVGKSNERAPMVLAMFLRSTIASHVECLENPFHVNKELRLFKFVSDFIAAYHELTKLVTTPFPFPLVQMSRTFVLIWVFSLPLSLAHDMSTLPALLFLIFFVTFGFVGLEFVAVEADDPFGDDDNDFDCLGLARVVFEDLYISIYDIDGKSAADTLRRGVETNDKHRRGVKTKPLSLSGRAVKKSSEAGRHKRQCSFDAFHNSVAAPRQTVGADRSRLLLDASSRLNQDMTLSHFVQQQTSSAITPSNASITRTETPSSNGSHSQTSLDLEAVFAASPPGGAFRFDSPNSNASNSPSGTPTPTYGATGTLNPGSGGRTRTSSREGLPPRPQDFAKHKRRSTSN
eukprot:CAMPEP_0181066304 /NCGR_PEP_ID=MMETSP1070-20121207/25239_1 /TAXON_ID=265543 /ORGANISM="Minutocellus polymorphus, Strain NH13" /LENGTH=542 /DNA_ID=CAMNT_0023146829 /DNA_START=43 /DNA_END=1672 /DNA_ORIENTATION=-